ncbi:F-box/FBD/LRR-repeat protein At1g13570-like isoform X1 [Rosa rugosa]|uniref:F-box/FBD/LRR-repeat protein At1g13570-like isoform X1 n=1 Tax=Rosa rugosa TaxID=74645 RepID=UPI002B40F8BF|nr:F-box/FBD/LRR-repeat protein At1g13570-like isoform X1 [Rosa rugosa]XP_062025372.1 F-box/FBD/LRR-repeat protein At1g13570-like isoform X1 [Rosa rugosa]
MDIEFDNLSDLPSDVTEKILSFLPMKEAVRTSILSSKWRYKWAMLPDLVFDELGFPGVLYKHDKLVKMVDHVLFLHIGPINKVKLSHKGLNGTADIDRWILHLSRNSMKEFTFEFWKKPEYKMPSCLFSCQDLVHLDLSNCLLKPPRTFKGFKSLKKLQIESVTLTQDEFENLIVCCPLLKYLTMIDCRGFTKLKIDAPNLRILGLNCAFEDLNLQHTLKLTIICISLEANGDQGPVPGSSSNLLKLLAQCAHVQGLDIQNYFLKYLAVGDLPVKRPKPCLHLKLLRINIDFNDLKEVLSTLYLLRSAPFLLKLYITVRQEGQALVGEVNSWLDDNQNFQLRKLQIVEVHGISSTKAGLDFIKFLLLNSPMLEKVFCKPASYYRSLELLKKMIQFKRSSALAEIIYLDP